MADSIPFQPPKWPPSDRNTVRHGAGTVSAIIPESCPSWPGIRSKISKLESDLGIRLLRKNTHQITVTDLGEKIYGHALTILAEANDVRALVEGSQQEPQGVLRAAIPVFVGIDFASRVGATFLQRYPKSRLEIRLVDNMVHPVKDGFDVVFGAGPLQDSTLIARKLFTLECFLCAAPEFIRTLPEPLTSPTQLNTLPFIDSGFYEEPRKLHLARGKKHYQLSPPVRGRANNFQISKQYILQGLGIGAMPNQIICSGELQEGSLVPVLPDWSLDTVDVYMLYPFQLSFSNLISAFYDTSLEIITQNTEKSGTLASPALNTRGAGKESGGPRAAHRSNSPTK